MTETSPINVLYIAENATHRQELFKRIAPQNHVLIIEWHNQDGIEQAIEQLSPQFICYLPWEYPDEVEIVFPRDSNSLSLIHPSLDFPLETAKEFTLYREGWILSSNLLKSILKNLKSSTIWTSLELANTLDEQGINYQWESTVNNWQNSSKEPINKSPISLTSKILAIVPHYQCEQFLYQSLSSLVIQTIPLDKIVVIDDNSELCPIDIVQQFPEVELLRSPTNVGPYRLIQQVIEETNYDAYLFQDADDWSTTNRLENLLKKAEQTGAELIGTQEWRVNEEQQTLTPVYYPLDVNTALAEKPGHPLLHPTSLVSRDLVKRLGGFATGLRFGGDTEFLLRAVFAARIVNVSSFCYFRRKRVNSLTTHPETGLDSPLRKQLLSTVKQRFYANLQDYESGKMPDLSPLSQVNHIQLFSII